MHQLALALHRKGMLVTGSDDEIFEPARSQLLQAGLLPQAEGWFPEKIFPDLDAVILGMHAKADNPELQKARELGIRVYSFPEYIYEASRQKKRVVIGGSHGKTTTTSMIMHVLQHAGADFDYMVGARLPGFEQSVSVTDAPVIVCEGDEYPASALERRPKFHFLYPHIAVLTGIAWDHINVFPTFENYLEQFQIFISKIEPGGYLVYNQEDAVLAKLVHENRRGDIHYLPYGVPPHEMKDGQTVLQLEGCHTPLKVFGAHNLMNLQAAWLVCNILGISIAVFCEAAATFTGADKRLQVMAENKETIVYRDFAHAPSKVKATTAAVRQQFPNKRLIAVLELHTYSSLSENFLDQYAGSLSVADEAAVFFSQHALELKRLPPIHTGQVQEAFGSDGLEAFDNRNNLEQWLKQRDLENAVVLFMSSGNYDGMDVQAWASDMAGGNR